MDEITRQVGQSSDDCHRRLDYSEWSLTTTTLYAGANGIGYERYGGGMRFTNITIPPGAIITEAHLTLRATATDTVTVVNTRISAEDIDDAPTFVDDKDIFDARWAARTAARVNWDAIPAWTLNTDYNSPDIKTVIKEIVDRDGWVSGNDIVIFWEDFEARSTVADYCFRRAYSYDGSIEFAPKLVITYGVVGWTGKVSGVTNPAKIMGVDVANIAKVKGVA